ncbi:MAG: division/cell wall cluster transcriptional repressor MraZ [Solirubrobacterales bacterium]|nr:division/cell wall cluster transcriptional repressor MraZ [Solirubrobacterales bacterium]
MPARFRAPLSEGIVLVAGLDPCVELYTPSGYEEFSQRFLTDLNRLGRKGRMMYRRFNASAQDESLDSAGRVRIARHLIDHAGLGGACMVVGVADHLEVWSTTRWTEHYAELDEQAERMAEELAAGPGAA